jgi:hypothetical protein
MTATSAEEVAVSVTLETSGELPIGYLDRYLESA